MTATATRATDPRTSAEAELAFTRSGARATHAARVLAVVREHPGLVGTEIGASVWPGDALGQIRAIRRLNDLRKNRLVRQGEPRFGLNSRREISWWPVAVQRRMML